MYQFDAIFIMTKEWGIQWNLAGLQPAYRTRKDFIHPLTHRGTCFLREQIRKVREDIFQAHNSTQIYGENLSIRTKQSCSEFCCSDLSRRLLFESLNRLLPSLLSRKRLLRPLFLWSEL